MKFYLRYLLLFWCGGVRGMTSCAFGAEGIFVQDYPAAKEAGALACDAHYYLWLPPSGKAVRAVIVHQHGCGDGAEKGCVAAAEDLHWQALAAKWDCALLGTSYRAGDLNCRTWADPQLGSRVKFHEALNDFAAETGHTELATVPWCLWGHSGGGWWCSSMLALEPQRIVAVWLRSGSAYGQKRWAEDALPPDVPDAALLVPVMTSAGSREKRDPPFRQSYLGMQEMFVDWRHRGALIGFSEEPDSSHEAGNSRYLAIPFFDACLAARLPDQNGAALKNMPQDTAWLALPDGGEPQLATAFKRDPNTAVWLPNATVAKAWYAFVKTGSVPDETPPAAPTEVLLREGVLTWKAQADLESGLRGFVILRNGVLLASLPEPQEKRTLFQGLSYHDTPNLPVLKMSYVDPSPLEGAKYRIIAVNSAGLKSELSEEQR